MRDTNIILIGPLAAGKSTIGKLLGESLNLPALELDDLRWDYYAELDYDADYAEQLRQEGGIRARGEYWKPFEIHSLERMLQDYPSGHVLSLGAGNTAYDDPAQNARAEEALVAYPYVVWLMPSPNADESLRLLTERFKALVPDCPEAILHQIIDLNRYFVAHPLNARLAKYTIYTAGKPPEVTRDEILRALKLIQG